MSRNLTNREREVLTWAARGKTYAETAIILGIGFATVKTHLDTMRLKMDAINVHHAIAIAFAERVLSRADLYEYA